MAITVNSKNIIHREGMQCTESPLETLQSNGEPLHWDYRNAAERDLGQRDAMDHDRILPAEVEQNGRRTNNHCSSMPVKHNHERWKASDLEVPRGLDACIQSLLHQQVESRSTSDAVVCWDGSVTYVELHRMTNSLAKHLQSHGVGLGSKVPLCFEKSLWMTISMISVLKAGGAFVPLDAAHPAHRLLDITKDVHATVVLSGSQFAHVFDGQVPTIISNVATLVKTLGEEEGGVCTELQPNDPAFILFTSGSTGKPKGIVHTHRSVCSSVAAYAPALNLTSGSRVLQFAAYSFDISVIDTIATLVRGGCLCVPSEDERLNDITGFIQRSGANWAFLTPSFARHIDPAEVPMLTNLVLGGESVTQDSMERWVSEPRRLYNGYGPAECAICVTQTLHPHERPSIGYGVGCLTWVIDPDNYCRLASYGQTGELLVEGPIVFDGYLNDLERTQAAFIEDPSWLPKKPNVRRRLYKTGDLVRRKQDGALVYVGRKDTQVKIRGQRVELGEIEHQLRNVVPSKIEIAVEIVDVARREGTLAAFIGKGDADLNVQILANDATQRLKQALPAYMVPSAFISVDKLPLTDSQKLDRRRLRDIATQLPTEQVAFITVEKRESQTLSTTMEHRLAALWIRVLNIESKLLASDHFFALGGDSLAAINLVAAARKEGLQISVIEVFQLPFLSDMALALAPLVTIAHQCRAFELVPQEEVANLLNKAKEQCDFAPDDIEIIEDIYPCTPIQEGLFALSMAQQGVYVANIVYKLPVDIDIVRFQASWNSVIQRNPILRSRMIRAANCNWQIVTRNIPSWEMSDAMAVNQLELTEYGRPLLRLGISGNPRKFVLSIHHCIFDAWSLDCIWQQVATAYTEDVLQATTSFNNFVRYLSCENTAKERSDEFWRTQLEGSVPASFPSLPSATYRPQADVSVRHDFHLSQIESDVTLALVVRAAWAMLLAQYTSLKDLTFGMTLSGRFAPFAGIENLIGPTISTLPIRIPIDPGSSVSSFLRAISDQATDMIPFEQTGLKDIARSCNDASSACQFASLLVVHPIPDPASTHRKRLYKNEPVTNISLPHALVLEAHLKADSIGMVASYDSSLVEDVEVRRFLAQLEHVVRHLWEGNREVRLKDIELMSPTDMTNVISQNQVLPPAEKYCIHERFEHQALMRPSAEAVCAWDGTLTYSELDSLSTRLAEYFSVHGIGPELIVPLCFDKSKWVIITLLAVLKAGGACLFLEPSWPRQRIDFVLKSVGATVVVSDPRYLPIFQGRGFTLLSISSDLHEDGALQSRSTTLPVVQPSNVAFVMFTSGSTGTPKGIVQEHSALYTSARNHASTCNINSDSRVLQFSAFTFDVYQIEICTTLTNGGCVCIPSETDRMNRLTVVMEEMRVNWAFFTPTFCRSMDPRQMPSLRTLLVGGEAVDKATIDKWVNHVLLLNCYGPAECGPSVMTEITPMHRPESIGYPLCVVCWIVDPDDSEILTPFGAVGELVLEGYTMARGYLNEPQKTAASFISPPKWLEKAGRSRGPRLYKTGDLVRYAKDGSLDYCGRKDTQVKVRGQRVELGEVEHFLRNCLTGSIDVAADTVQLLNSQGRTSLVAFICLKERGTAGRAKLLNKDEEDFHRLALATEGLRSRMESSVPSSMVPSAIVLISKMPMNSSGKLDRKQLKNLASSLPSHLLSKDNRLDTNGTEPTTKMERNLQALWRETLPNLKRPVLINDHFFHLGADSITAMTLVASARTAGLMLTVEQIFKHPVFSDMAIELRSFGKEGFEEERDLKRFELLPRTEILDICSEVASICNVSEEQIEDVYPCTPLQEGLLALSILQPSTYTAQNIYSLPSSLDLHCFRAAWDLAVQQYTILRTRVLQITGGVYQVVLRNTIEWQTHGDFRTYVDANKQNPIGNGDAMIRLALFAGTGQDDRCFVLTLHHCIYDGWSMDMLWRNVNSNFSGLKLAASPAPFNKFIKYILAADKEANDLYWRNQLSGASLSSFPTVPHGHQPLTTSFIKNSNASALPKAKVSYDVTISTLVRAAWALVIAHHCAAEDVTLGVVTSGRTAPVNDIDRMVAPVITTVPVRIQLDREMSLADMVKRLHTQAAEMLPFEQTGLQNIKQCLDPEAQRSLDFQNLLVIQPAVSEHEQFPGVRCISDGSDFVVPHALVMVCSLACDGFHLQASFDPHVLDPDTVFRLMSQLEHTLTQLATSNPSKKLSDIDMLPSHERQMILAANAKVQGTVHECVHDIIEQRTAESPQSMAVSSWDGEISYETLDHLSTKLFKVLRARGAKPGLTIPVFFEKSKWAIVAILGIVKAGASFVLVDQSVSMARLETILSTIGAQIVLTSELLSGQLGGFDLSHIIVVDQASIDSVSPEACVSQMPNAKPQDVLYINFTSGTTSNTPKAVVTEHQAYSTGALEHGKRMAIKKNSRILQFASYNFDGAIVEILTTLMHGACICIPSEKDRLDNVSQYIDSNKVTMASFTPTIARATVDPAPLKSLQTLILVGEPMTGDDIARFQAPGLRLINGYGLTECCVCSSLTDVVGIHSLGSIGKAIASNYWVTEPANHDRLAAIGTIGELLIEGPILAREYLNDRERTEASFIHDPAWSKEFRSMRLYKTGDLVRQKPDGTLVIIGRKDMQVKLRGQRIDLPEVEGYIKRWFAQYSSDVACNLIASSDHGGSAALAAFICFERSAGALDTDMLTVAPAAKEPIATAMGGLKALMCTELSTHMVPTFFIPVSHIPVMSSGKVDRKKLVAFAKALTASELASFSSATRDKRQLPSTNMEIRLSYSWSKVLGIQRDTIGANDNFLLWADSIGAIRLTAALRQEGLAISAADIMSHPILLDMATVVGEISQIAVAEPPEPFALVGGRVEPLLDEVARHCAIDADAVQDVYPCTPLQEGLMALSVKSGGSYVAQNVFSLPHSLDIGRFISAWAKVTEANPILRTRIVQTKANGCVQIVVNECFSYYEGDALAKYLEQDQRLAPSFGSALNRFALILAPKHRHMVWTSHHATYDGWTVDIIFRQLERAYNGFDMGQSLGFNHYICHLNAQDTGEADNYWQSFAEKNNAFPFPKSPTKSSQPHPDKTLHHRIDLSSEIRPTSTIIYAAWAYISARYMAAQGAAFGVVLNGRTVNLAGIEKVVGPTITTIPFCVDVAPESSVHELLESITSTLSESTSFAYRGLQNIRRLSAQAEEMCSFQTVLVIQPDVEVSMPCGTSGSPETSQDLSKFNNYGLMLEFKLRAGKVAVTANFDQDLIDQTAMGRILSQFVHVLGQMTNAASTTKLSDIEIATEEDIMEVWKQQNVIPPARQTLVHDLVSAHAALHSDKLALHSWDGKLTYGRLEELSSRLSRYLAQNAPIKSGSIVPICFERSMWTVVCILAVLKAGGAVLLLDPTHPTARLQSIVHEARAETVLCDPKFAAILQAHRVIEVTPELITALPEETPLDIKVQSTNMSFIISTSGSTGKPKLMTHTHEGICTSILGYGSTLKISERSRILQFAAYSFDISINEMFATLFHGGCLCIPSENDRLNNVAKCINDMQVNWLFAVPSFVRHIKLLPEHVPYLQTLVLGGETVNQELLDIWSDKVDLLSAYGPAECQICTAGPLTEARTIGFANGCVCHIVDPTNIDSLMPLGMIGELIVQGPVVARGYLNAPGTAFQVAPRWLPSRSNRSPGVYRTGDLVRFNADGSLTYIGRVDDAQAKLRGQRLELSELEYHVSKLLPNSIQVTAAIIDQTKHAVLVAFLSGEINSRKLTNDLVRTYVENLWSDLYDTLPKYMVPHGFFCLDAIPCTVSGKIDRKKLQDLAIHPRDTILERASERSDETPLSDREQMLKTAWVDVLRVQPDEVASNSDFFRLGGDSILAIRLVTVARASDLHLNVPDIFENPKLRDMAKIAKVPTFEEDPLPFALIPKMTEDILATAADQCHTQKDQIEDISPCTPLQEGLFALSQKAGAYIARSVFELPPDLDVIEFKHAWDETSLRNPILRTAIIQTPSEGLVQVVLKDPAPWHESTTLHDRTEYNNMMRFGDRLTKFVIADTRYFILYQHHATYDGYSLPQIFRQVEDAYKGVLSQFSPAPYNRFVRYVMNANGASSRDFWAKEMDGANPSMFPTSPPDYQPRPSSHVELKAKIGQATKQVTMSTLLRAAWAVLISSYVDNADVIFGITLSGRQAAVRDIESIPGPTITTVPMRIQIDREAIVDDFLEAVQTRTVKAIPHEQYGLQNIQKISSEVKAACNFHNILIVHPEPRYAASKDSIHIPYVENEEDHVTFRTYPLNIECTILSKDEILLESFYDSNLIDEIRMSRILGQLQHLVGKLSQAGQQKLGDLDLISLNDMQELAKWNARSPLAESHPCVHGLIEHQVQTQCARHAVRSWDGDLTYHRLSRLSSRLAYYLSSQGVGPEIMIPVCFEKSLWIIVAVMAVMKAGGCFVPLDPSHPKQRLLNIIGQTQAPLVLTSSQDDLSFSNSLIINEETIEGLPHPPTDGWLDESIRPENALYTIFTSGSTGQPKGVVIEHQAFCAASNARRRLLGLDSDSRVLQFSSYSFDVSIEDMLSTLFAGGCICIPSEHERMNDINGAMRRMQVNFANLTPSVASLLRPDDAPSLKVLALGGEPMTEAHIQSWSNRVHLMNFYGPTECSVTVCLNEQVGPGTHPRNIGRPVGCHGWVVERSNYNKLMPIGAIGELVIEGPVLARGYLHDPAKTENAFIENPLWTQEPKRLYKTGDLVHYNSNGTMTYVGRVEDSQVKIRGQRVELGEIEHHLRTVIPEARGVAVELVEQPHGHVLTAFINLESEGSESSKDIISSISKRANVELQQRLPTHMIPSAMVLVEHLPLTLAGKIDRRKLKQIGQERLSTAQFINLGETTLNMQPPASALEERMQFVWAEVLNIPAAKIGVTSPFFTLGGDSITAMQVVARCRSLGLSVTTYDVLQYKTITKICDIIEASQNKEQNRPQHVEVKPGTYFDLSPMQREHFLLMPDGNNLYQQSFLLQISQRVSAEIVREAIEKTVRSHSIFRTKFSKNENSHWVQWISESSSGAFTFESYTEGNVDEIRVGIENAIDITRGPVLGAALIEMEEQQLLFLTAHHLVIDLVSWRIILRELEEAIMNPTVALANEVLSFPTWCRLQDEHAQSRLDAVETLPCDPLIQDNYWGLKELSNTYDETLSDSFNIDKECSTVLLGACNNAFRTESLEIFLAAIFQSFHTAFPDRASPAFFNEGHGRESWDDTLDISGTVGWFTTIYPLVVEASDSITEMVSRAKDARRAVPGNGWPFFTSHHLNAKRDKPLAAEIVFNYQGHYQQLERKDALFQLPPIEKPSFSRPGANVKRPSPFEISVSVHQGKIRFDFVFHQNMLHQSRIRHWIQECRSTLHEAARTLPEMDPRYTLSDFPLLPAEFKGIDNIIDGVGSSNIEDIYPCSAMQRKMYLSQARGSGCYEATTTWKVTPRQGASTVDLDRLSLAWQAMVDRNSILRSCIMEKAGHVVQVVLKDYRAEISIRALNEEGSAQRSLFDEMTMSQRQNRPMHRMTLQPQASGEVLCALEISHALIDGASLSVLLKELSSSYGSGLPPPSNALAYKDFIQHLQKKVRQSAVNYWTTYLASAQPCNFPSTHSESAFSSSQSVTVDLTDLQPSLHPLCQRHGTTISTLFQTVWALVLRHFTHQDAISFGYLISGRDIPLPRISMLIGPVFNLLPCCVELHENTTLVEALEMLHADNVSSVRHHDLSLPEIEEGDDGDRRGELFKTLINFRKYATAGMDEIKDKSASSTIFEPMGGYDPFDYDIVVGIAEHEQQVSVMLTYWRSRISEELMEVVERRFKEIVQDVLERGEEKIGAMA